MFQLIQPSGYFQRALFFSPKSLCLFAQCAHWTQSGPHRSTRDWRPGLGLEIHMQGLWQEPPGKRMIDSLTLVQAREEHLKPGYSLHGEACPCLPTMRHWACYREMGCVMYTVRGVTIQQHKARPSWRRKWASIMWTMRSKTLKLQNL